MSRLIIQLRPSECTQSQSERFVEWNLVYSVPLIVLNCVSAYSCNDFEVFQLNRFTVFAPKASILFGFIYIYARNFVLNVHKALLTI
jgi:hypothetical protein